MADTPQHSPIAGDAHNNDYNPYDPRNYDSGGFGYGGTNGSGDGFGGGGMGPQQGYASQSNYGQGQPAGDDLSWRAGDDADGDSDHIVWRYNVREH